MEHEQPVNIKQRMVGAIVLVCLAIIIIPIILRPNHISRQQFQVQPIPEMPEEISQTLIKYSKPPQLEPRPPMPEPESVPVDAVNRNQVESLQLKTMPSAKVVARPLKPNYRQSYTIQVGSFSQQHNALRLEKKLKQKGYHAFVEKIHISSGYRYRVRVGPFVRYEQAEQLQKKIRKQFKLDTRITIYQ